MIFARGSPAAASAGCTQLLRLKAAFRSPKGRSERPCPEIVSSCWPVRLAALAARSHWRQAGIRSEDRDRREQVLSSRSRSSRAAGQSLPCQVRTPMTAFLGSRLSSRCRRTTGERCGPVNQSEKLDRPERVGSSSSLPSNADLGRPTRRAVGCNLFDDRQVSGLKVERSAAQGSAQCPALATAVIRPPNS